MPFNSVVIITWWQWWWSWKDIYISTIRFYLTNILLMQHFYMNMSISIIMFWWRMLQSTLYKLISELQISRWQFWGKILLFIQGLITLNWRQVHWCVKCHAENLATWLMLFLLPFFMFHCTALASMCVYNGI